MGTSPDVDATSEAEYAALRAQPALPRSSVHSLRAAWWALRAVRQARRRLRIDGLSARVSPPPASLPWGSRTGVNGVLGRLAPTCLEKALVLQTWLAAHRIHREIVIGVAADTHADEPAGTDVRNQGERIRAHAWVDGTAHPAETSRYTVIHRIDPR